MADLVVIGYPDEATASSVYAKVEQLQRDLIVDGAAAVLTRTTAGAILDALMAKLPESGIDEFRSRVQQVLAPGGSAVVLSFSNVMPDKALAALAPYGGEVLQRSLTLEVEHEIRAALGSAARTVGAGSGGRESA
jgi:uncharacterized membrane protein